MNAFPESFLMHKKTKIHLNGDKITISKDVQMVFLHGLGLNGEEQEFLKDLVKSWRKADGRQVKPIIIHLAILID